MSNLSILQNKTILTMTSREIATLTNKRHDNVTRVCRELIEQGLTSQSEELTFEHNGNKYTEFKLCKRDSILLVARLSPEFTAKLVDRWQELENQQPKHILPNFNNPVESARAWADAKESEIKALANLEAAQPAIEFVNRYTNAEGLKGFREVCKLLGAKENQFREFLTVNRIMYRLNGVWTAYASHLEAGRFEIKTGLSDADHSFNQAMFTAKGVAWISKLWSEGNGSYK